jgi:hypothetical protein
MQLLTISQKTQNNDQKIGDIIGVFPDTHIFSDHEHDIFNIIHTDLTEEEINAKKPIMRPIVEPEVSIEYAIAEGKTEQALTMPSPEEQMIRKPTMNLVTMNELNEEVLIPLTDDIRPRFDLRFENGEIIENYTRARTK